MPLTFAAVGTPPLTIKKVGDAETRRFLETLGFVAGGNVTVINEIQGNVIVNVKTHVLLFLKRWLIKLWFRRGINVYFKRR